MTENSLSAHRSWDEFVEDVSRCLTEAAIHHSVTKKPGHTLSLNITGIQSFKSLRDIAAALERAKADFTYSAGSGFSLYRRSE